MGQENRFLIFYVSLIRGGCEIRAKEGEVQQGVVPLRLGYWADGVGPVAEFSTPL